MGYTILGIKLTGCATKNDGIRVTENTSTFSEVILSKQVISLNQESPSMIARGVSTYTNLLLTQR